MLLSGGIDSATCLYLARRKGYRTRALTVEISRAARGETAAARAVAKTGGVTEHRFFPMPWLREAGESGLDGRLGLPPTFIPMKNAIYYSAAAAYAEENEAKYIIGGHNKDDSLVFEDTHGDFFKNLQATIWSASMRLKRRKTTILRPLQHMTKPEVVIAAARLGVPFELTWSCHRDGARHCWRCEGCAARASAFERSGVTDPLREGKLKKA